MSDGQDGKVSFAVLFDQHSSYCICAYQPILTYRIFSDVRNAPQGKHMRLFEAFQLPSLQFKFFFFLKKKRVRAVLAFRQVSMNSHVTKQLQATVPVTLLQFRPSESSFVFLCLRHVCRL